MAELSETEAKTAQLIARGLLDIGAFQLRPHQPFTWSSGWKSPVYCDNRMTLAYPALRNVICEGFVHQIEQAGWEPEVIAAVATGAIPHGMLVADRLNLPFVYVRPKAKEHGRGNQVEGDLMFDQPVVVIEDLVSTGGSSIKAVNALREFPSEVLGMVSIFSYGFPQAAEALAEARLTSRFLCPFSQLLEEAVKQNEIQAADLALIERWQADPANYEPEQA